MSRRQSDYEYDDYIEENDFFEYEESDPEEDDRGDPAGSERQRTRRAQRRRRRRRSRVTVWIVVILVVAVVFVLLAAAGVLPGVRLAGRSRSTAESSEGSTEPAEESTAEEEPGEASGGSVTQTDAASAQPGETESGENGSEEILPEEAEPAGISYIFTRTADTIDLGQSLTDISVYDSQRHITREDAGNSGSGNTEENAEENSSSGTESDEGSTEGTEDDPALAPDYVDSQYAILVNADTGEIVAEREGTTRIVPASMTKVMTILTAVEAMDDPDSQLNDTFEMNQEIADAVYLSGSSFVGYGVGDEVRVEDLLYGAILPSGGDAAMGLAEYIAGSQEAFADLMNEKAEELGISGTTHFTNCVGLYDEDHYSTPCDMAVIMQAAYENDLCRKVLSTHTWTVSPTASLPDGADLSNWFLRKIEDHIDSGTVECAKTGFVNESGNCAVSTYVNAAGVHYIACTALTYNSWRCIFDHANLYMTYAQE